MKGHEKMIFKFGICLANFNCSSLTTRRLLNETIRPRRLAYSFLIEFYNLVTKKHFFNTINLTSNVYIAKKYSFKLVAKIEL